MPLVPDAWFDLVLTVLGSPPFVEVLGHLDGEGRGTARLDWPASVITDPALVGLTREPRRRRA